MGSIRDLLNPLPEVTRGHLGFIMPSSRSTMTASSSSERHKRSKAAKDFAVFRSGPIQGELRYPPHEERTPLLEKEHRKHNLKPYGNIADYPRHIPYQSDKKSFRERTGRDSFHVFQYTFQREGVDEEPWTVTWDYNIGLVRTTHLFKCLGHSKTTPGRVLALNEGLREISHSITGGALAAQGYWMPFGPAKAIAATFCWEIRYLLTPLFGINFPDTCIRPDDRAKFGKMVIAPAIVEEAAKTARYYRSLERPLGYDDTSPTSFPLKEVWRGPPVPCKLARHNYPDSISSARGSSSEPYCGSPQSPTYRGFNPVNRPPSSHPATRTANEFLNEATMRRKRAMKIVDEGSDSEEAEFSSTSRSDVHPKSKSPLLPGRLRVFPDEELEPDETISTSSEDDIWSDDGVDDEYRERHCTRSSSGESAHGKPALKKNPSRSAKAKPDIEKDSRPTTRFAKEVKAAEALLDLRVQRASSKDTDGDEMMEELIVGPAMRFVESGKKKRRRASL